LDKQGPLKTSPRIKGWIFKYIQKKLHEKHSKDTSWVLPGQKASRAGKGKGRRIILLNAGSQNGWIEGAKKIW